MWVVLNMPKTNGAGRNPRTHSLVVGKFCPLHNGHAGLIANALMAGDVTVVVYDMPGFPEYPIEKRIRWVSKLFPEVNAVIPMVDHFNGDNSAAASPLYAAELEPFGPFTHVYSSEDYGVPFAKALSARHVMFDYKRVGVHISGTEVRRDPFGNRHYVPRLVYRDMVQKVAFFGGESTGKSTIAQALSERYNTQWVHEYGRELWEAQGGSGSFSDLLKIGVEQYRREEELILDSDRYLFCDTTAMTTEYWCRHYYDFADHRLVDLVEHTKDEYIYFLCGDDFDYVQDGWRETEAYHSEFHQGVIDDLDRRGIRYATLTGSLEDRIEQVAERLDTRVLV